MFKMGETTGVSFFGPLDVLVLSGVAGFAIYYFMFKKKKEVPAFKKLTVGPTLERSASHDASFVNRMKHGGRNVVIFYGSQTGTAEEFASRLAKDSTRYGMKAIIADPEECEMEDLSRLPEIANSLAIFVLATYGEGDPTDNAQEFYDWLQDGGTQLEGVNYAVFGLGNKTYEHFNAMGKYVDRRLEELGAKRIYEVGMGDDDANIEEDFITWRDKFWPAVCENFGIAIIGEDVSIRQYALTIHDDFSEEEKLFSGEPVRLGSFRNQKPPYDAKNPFLAPVHLHRELHKSGDRSCMHIEFDITGSKIRYDAGDHVAVYPVNSIELVEKLGKRLDVDLGLAFTLTNVDEDASKKHPFPCPTTYRTALLHYLDITSCPRTNVLKELSEYAMDPTEKEFLLKLAQPSAEGKELYHDWIINNHRTVLHVLEDLPSVKPPIDHICELLPKLQARYYSISSSPKVNPNIIAVTAVLVEYDTLAKRHMEGVATGWLKEKNPSKVSDATVPIFVRKSQFRLPFKPSVPVIMIGPGTGLAPFRGFIQERHSVKTEGKPIGETVLYFGCRRQDEDYIYEDELKKFKDDGALTKLYVAFSRDQAQKVYVQHLLSENGEEIWNILDQGGHLYVCGDARHMAHDVDAVLQKVIASYGKMDSMAAQDYLKKLRSRGRCSCDVWS